MRVRTKLVIVIAFVALGPLALSAWMTLDLHRVEFERKVREVQLVSARYGATIAQSHLEAAQRGLAGIVQGSTYWPSLSQEEREGGTWLVFSQLDETGTVMVFDADHNLLEPAAFIPPAVDDPEWAAHPHLSEQDLRTLRSQFPFAAAREHGSAIGEAAFFGDDIVLPIAFAVDGNTSTPWTVGVGLSISRICDQIVGNRPPDTHATVWDAQGRALCRSDTASQIPFERIQASGDEAFRFTPTGNPELFAAVAKTAEGWSVVIEQPAAEALAASRQMLLQVLLWIGLGLLAALLTGTILSRGITKPLRSLEQGARRVAGGDYATQIGVEAEDELGEVAHAFNAMSTEIQAWNLELTSRVDERTSELKAAQDQLIAVRKLAAMASLSAGVAHELNNPLAAILAFAQILLSRARKAGEAKEVKMLETLEMEAMRIRDIVERMERLSSDEDAEHEDVDVRSVFDVVLERMEKSIDEASIVVERHIDPTIPLVRGAPTDLATVLEYLCDNAIKAMGSDPRRLELHARHIDGDVVIIEVRDTGRGMAAEHVERAFEPFYTTKDGDWRGAGLGLSVAHRIVGDHGGSIRIMSTEGAGTTVSINLPAAQHGAHLE